MKKSILLLSSALSLLTSNLSAQYSNASWDGAWLLTGVAQNYAIFDGAGNISSLGVPQASGTGTYSINAGGVVSGSIYFGVSTFPFSGNFTNDSTTSIVVNLGITTVPATFIKVKNAAVMAGTYDGTIVQTAGGSATLPINFTVDASGNITSSTNLTGTVSGALYYSNGKVSGLIKSGEAAPFTEIEINITSGYSGSTSLSGVSTLTGSGNTGTFSLTKSTTVGVQNTSSNLFSAYPNPAKDQFVIEGATNGTVKIYDVLGNELMNTTITSSKTILNVSTLSKGVYFYNINAGTAVSAGKFIVE
ncbi:MAG: T9SS type A sorting domain-containing protein [Bacteroidetes bacterium]|nr:T9SS type A sorting domain-containing protein [Bacteroidota bacterium]